MTPIVLSARGRRRVLWRRVKVAAAMGSASVLFTLLMADIALSRFSSLARDPMKTGLQTIRGFGHCYRSSDPALPIDLLSPSDQRDLGRILLDPKMETLQKKAARCVTYDTRRRRFGAHPERRNQVAIVGDSFAFGEGVSDEKTLGFLLSERFSTINFPSFAGSGFGVNQVKTAVDRALDDPRRPSEIVYFYNINDVVMTAEMERRFSYVMDFENVRWEEVKRGDPGWFARHSALYNLVRRVRFMRQMTDLTTENYLAMYFDPINAPALRDTLATLEGMVRRAHEHGVGFWFVFYPLLHKDLFGRYPFDPIHRFMMEACGRWGAGCIDASAAFAGQRRMTSYVVDASDFHPNGVGNRRVTEYLAQKPGFLEKSVRPRTFQPPPGTVRIPAKGLTASSPGVTLETARGDSDGFLVLGPMLSLDVEPETPGSYRVTLAGHGTGCRSASGEEWPEVGVYVDDHRVDSVSFTSSEGGRFVSAGFPLQGRSTLRFVFLNDYADSGCDRNVYLDAFDITSAP